MTRKIVGDDAGDGVPAPKLVVGGEGENRERLVA